MRKGVMIVSLVSFVCLSVGFIIRALTKPVELLGTALSGLPSVLLISAGFLVLVAALMLYVIYWYRQERAKTQQFTHWGMVVRTNQDLLRCKAEQARPYKRELWLQIALFASLGIVLLSAPVMGFLLPRIAATFALIVWLCAPVSILICTFLSRDLAKKSET